MKRLLARFTIPGRPARARNVETIKPPAHVCLAVCFRYGSHHESTILFRDMKAGCRTCFEHHGILSPETWRPHPDRDYGDALAIDLRPVFERRPIVILHLPRIGNVPDGKPHRLQERAVFGLRAAMLRSLARHTDLGQPLFHLRPDCSVGALDVVSARDFAALLKPFRARIGRIDDGEIVWESEAKPS